jgi:hypothetical protein
MILVDNQDRQQKRSNATNLIRTQLLTVQNKVDNDDEDRVGMNKISLLK